MEEKQRTFTEAPTFGKHVYADTDHPDTESETIVGDEDNLNFDDFEFEFAFTPALESEAAVTTADEIFSRGQIRPVFYPVFNRSLVAGGLETPAEGDLTDGIGRLELSLEAPYCIWKQKSAPQSPTQSAPQSPDRCQKSNSTGSEFRRFRIRDLLLLGRSRRDDKVKSFLLPEAEKEVKRSLGCPAKPGNRAATEAEKKGQNGKENGRVGELDVVQAYRRYYGKGVTGRRRRFLPLRRDLLVGFFG